MQISLPLPPPGPARNPTRNQRQVTGSSSTSSIVAQTRSSSSRIAIYCTPSLCLSFKWWQLICPPSHCAGSQALNSVQETTHPEVLKPPDSVRSANAAALVGTGPHIRTHSCDAVWRVVSCAACYLLLGSVSSKSPHTPHTKLFSRGPSPPSAPPQRTCLAANTWVCPSPVVVPSSFAFA